MLSVGDVFDSFSSFKEKLALYEKKNNVLYVKDHCQKLSPYYPDSARLEYEHVRVACKQGTRRKTSSKGIRPNQKSIKCGCKSFILLRLVKAKDRDGKDMLVIKKLNLEHENHPVNHLTASVYPENRRPVITDELKAMIMAGASTHELRSHILRHQGKQVLRRDIHNIARKILQESTSGSQEVGMLQESTSGSQEVVMLQVSTSGSQEVVIEGLLGKIME